MSVSDAYQRFLDSTVMNYEKWHDGEGYDLAVLDELTEAERQKAEALMLGRIIEWREIEVLERLNSAKSWEAIRDTYEHARESDTRLAAAVALERAGKLDRPIDEVIAQAIMKLRTIEGGLTRALLLAEEHPTVLVKHALLHASEIKSEAAMHCAALLCFLCGKAKEPFDWELRPYFCA
jgi:hypothetical protein